MKAVILAAGRGTRMGNLTDTVPKPMLVVCGKNLIEHKINILPDEVDEVVLVVGYLGDAIRKHFGDTYKNKKISYVEEPLLKGTGFAIFAAQEHLKNDRFISLMGDDLYDKADIEEVIKHPWAALAKKVSGPQSGGRMVLNDDGELVDIVEGKHEGDELLVSTGLFVMGPELFKYALVKIPNREEYGLPQTLLQVASRVPIKLVEAKSWFQISNPDDLKKAEEFLKQKTA